MLGLLALLLGLVFWTTNSRHPFWQRFYGVVPALLLCYFLPSLLNTFDVVDAEQSRLYYVSSRYLLPACLVLLTLSIDLPAIARLGRKALIMFFTGTLGILFGGPLAVLVDAGGAPVRREGGGNIAFTLAGMPVVGDVMSQLLPRSLVARSLSQSVSNQDIVTDAAIDRYWELARYPGNRSATRKRLSASSIPRFSGIPGVIPTRAWTNCSNASRPSRGVKIEGGSSLLSAGAPCPAMRYFSCSLSWQ